MYTDTASSTIDSRNGIRQPQVSNASPSAARQTRMTTRLRKSPSVAVVWIQLV